MRGSFPGSHQALYILLAAWLLAIVTPTLSQNCSPSGVIATDVQLQNLSACTTITGDLTIGDGACLVECSITDLSPLNSITAIQGSLRIQCCNSLTQISDFSSLSSVDGAIRIYYNALLTDIGSTAFPMLMMQAKSVEISQNQKLQAINGFQLLRNITDYLQVDRNTALVEIEGFRNLQTIGGGSLVEGHALAILYNGNLTSLSGLANTFMSYGTVHIEGNTKLCHAGYPRWNVGSYPIRLPLGDGDQGIDWRTRLIVAAAWQFDWSAGGFPSLVVRDNGDAETCASAGCHSSCPSGAGCFSPSMEPTECGTCGINLPGIANTCTAAAPAPATPPPCPSMPIPYSVVEGFFYFFIVVVALVLTVVGIVAGVWLYKKYKVARKGSFDVQLGDDTVSTNSNIELVPSGDYRQPSSSQSIQLRTASGVIAEPSSSNPTVDRRSAKSQSSTIVMSSYRQNTDQEESTGQHPRAISTSSLGRGGEPERERSRSPRQRPAPPPPRPAALRKPSKSEPDGRSGAGSGSDADGAARVGAGIGAVVSASSSPVKASPERVEKKKEEEKEEEKEVQDIPMTFPRSQLRMVKELGMGDFGKVIQCEARKLVAGQKKTTVVVKQLKETASEQERAAFLRPVEAMKLLRHPNVLSLRGVCTEGPSIMVMLEYPAHGDLKTYLVRKRSEAAAFKQSKLMTKMACDMAAGLNYLHSRSIAHNDVAARNCVVISDLTVKVGDYGISRQIYKEDYYSRAPDQKAWPIRWMAPEIILVQGRSVLDSLPSSMPSNVWSFGVSLWELCSFAQWPYEELTNEEVVQSVRGSGRCSLESPFQSHERSFTPLFSIMQQCWAREHQRPTMSDLHAKLQAYANGSYPIDATPHKKSPTHTQDEPTASPVNKEASRRRHQSPSSPVDKEASRRRQQSPSSPIDKEASRRQQPSSSSPIDKEATRRASTPSSPVDREAARRKTSQPPLHRPMRAAPRPAPHNPRPRDREEGRERERRQRTSPQKEAPVESRAASLLQPLPSDHVDAAPRGTSPVAAATAENPKRPAKKKSKTKHRKMQSRSSEALIHSQSSQGSQGDEDGVRLNPVFVNEAISDAGNPLFRELEAEATERHLREKEAEEVERRLAEAESRGGEQGSGDTTGQARYTFTEPDPEVEDEWLVRNEAAGSGPFEMPMEDEDFILEPPMEYSQDSNGPSDGLHFSVEAGFDASPDGAVGGATEPDGDFGSLSRRSQKRLNAHRELEAAERSVRGAGSPTWAAEEDRYDRFDHRDALEEDDAPNVVLDDEIAALIW